MNMLAKNQSLILHKILCLFMVSVFCMSAVMSGTYGWFGIVNALNEFRGSAKVEQSVVLEKYALDSEGKETEITVSGAGFALYWYNETAEEWKQIENPEDENGLYYTDQHGKISIAGLIPGKYVFVEVIEPYGYTFDTRSGQPLSDYYFTIPDKKDEEPVQVVVYNQILPTEVELTKHVTNGDGSELTEEQLAKEFIFEVSFSDGKLYKYYKDSDKDKVSELEAMEDDPQTGVLKLKHGQTAHFLNVPPGVECIVRERDETGYRKNGNNHQITARLPDADGNYAGIDYENIYEVSDLTIGKTISGDENDDKLFQFKVEFADGGSYSYIRNGDKSQVYLFPEDGIIELGDGDSVTFLELPVGLEYTATEMDYRADGYIASPQSVDGTIWRQGNAEHFVNYRPEEETGSLDIRKTVVADNGDEIDEDTVFTFKVEFSEEGTYTYEKSDGTSDVIEGDHGEVELKHGESIKFINIPAGVLYKVTETELDGWTAAISSVSGEISAYRTSEARFYNRADKEAGEDETGGIVLEKYVDGTSDGEDSTEFAFEIVFEPAGVYYYQLNSGELLELPEDGVILMKQGDRLAFPDLPAGVKYSITEKDSEGYTPTVSVIEGTVLPDQDITIRFDNISEDNENYARLKIGKEVYGTGADKKDVFDFKVEFSDADGKKLDGEFLYIVNGNEGTTYKIKNGETISLKHGENVTFLNLPEDVYYSVTELANDLGYKADNSKKSGYIHGSAEVLFRNYREKEVKLIVRKVVENGPAVKDTFRFTVTINGKKHEFTLQDGETKEFRVHPGDRYEVLEEDPYQYGYIQKSVSNGNGIVGDSSSKIEIVKTNTYMPSIIQRTGISVEKVWMHGSNSVHPGSVYVQLYRDGLVYGPVMKLSEENGWRHTWVGLNKAYDWTVDEEKVPTGYEKKITGNAESGYTITNIHDTDDGTGKGRPDPGEDPDPGREKVIRPGDEGDSGDQTDSDDGSDNRTKGPKTGDTTQFWFWCILMISSAIVLRRILFGEDKRSIQK